MARRNVLAGLVLLAISIGYGLTTVALPDRSLPNTPGPAFFPWLITIVLLVLSVALVTRGLIDARAATDEAPGYRVPSRGWLALSSFILYLVMLPYLGFVLASVPFFAVLMWLYGERNKMIVAVASIVIPVVIFYLFTEGFQILLPRGPRL